MSTTAVKSFWSGVRDAAKDTPRMYIEGAKDIAGAVSKVFGVHRDVKPQNVRTVGSDGVVIIERGRHGGTRVVGVVRSTKVKHQSAASSALRVNKATRAKKLHKKP